MSIGYACLVKGREGLGLRTCSQKNATNESLAEIIQWNLDVLEAMIEYNHSQNIRLFRISSDLIPFGSSPVNRLCWWETFEDSLTRIGDKIKKYHIRVSMHPGQYTVLNSPDPAVVERAVDDLIYHCRILDSMLLDQKHKLILHIGGVYGDKLKAMDRFVDAYHRLPDGVKRRLILENDERCYTIEEVLAISNRTGAPVVFDNLHHRLNPSVLHRSDADWIHKCSRTWKKEDGPQKIHYSQQAHGKRAGSHSFTINTEEFLDFYEQLPEPKTDIMLEVKDKNWSAIKCINGLTKNRSITALEQEWSRYKYLVLEHSPVQYQEIRNLLKKKTAYPVILFYQCVDEALDQEVEVGHAVNAAQHVWGYFKDLCNEKEKMEYERRLLAYEQGKGSLASLKKHLWKLSCKYRMVYLLDSYYFSGIMETPKK